MLSTPTDPPAPSAPGPRRITIKTARPLPQRTLAAPSYVPRDPHRKNIKEPLLLHGVDPDCKVTTFDSRKFRLPALDEARDPTRALQPQSRVKLDSNQPAAAPKERARPSETAPEAAKRKKPRTSRGAP